MAYSSWRQVTSRPKENVVESGCQDVCATLFRCRLWFPSQRKEHLKATLAYIWKWMMIFEYNVWQASKLTSLKLHLCLDTMAISFKLEQKDKIRRLQQHSCKHEVGWFGVPILNSCTYFVKIPKNHPSLWMCFRIPHVQSLGAFAPRRIWRISLIGLRTSVSMKAAESRSTGRPCSNGKCWMWPLQTPGWPG